MGESGPATPKAFAAIESLLLSFPMDGRASDSHASEEMSAFLESWDRLDRYQLLALAGALVRWVAHEKQMTEVEVLTALREENWPSA